MFRQNGNSIRTTQTGRPPSFDYAEVISIALRHELGSDAQSIQIIANWTGATDRTVTNWLAGTSGPKGLYLIRLLRKSDSVLETVLSLAARAEMLDLLYESRRQGSGAPASPAAVKRPLHSASRDPYRDPNDPQADPLDLYGLGVRQHWFLQEVRRRPLARAKDIERFFGVSAKTAKRDIAGLKAHRLIDYRGSSRRGHYVRLEPSD